MILSAPPLIFQGSPMNPEEILREAHNVMQILPRIRKDMLHERLRTKVGEDISSIMVEQGVFIEVLAHRLRKSRDETRNWIWTRDLTLSELTRLLDALDSEFYPMIRSRKLRR
jgi:hypothetical protein